MTDLTRKHIKAKNLLTHMKGASLLVLVSICYGAQISAQNTSSKSIETIGFYVSFQNNSQLITGSDLQIWSADNSLQAYLSEYAVQSVSKVFQIDDPLLNGVYTIRITGDTTGFIDGIQKFPEVEYAELIPVYEVFHTPNDLHNQSGRSITSHHSQTH